MRLYHPRTGVPVDFPDTDRQLIRYYRREGYVDRKADVAKAPAAPKKAAKKAASPRKRTSRKKPAEKSVEPAAIAPSGD